MLVETTEYQLSEKLYRVSEIQPAYDRTVAILATTNHKTERLCHFDHEGKLLNQYDFGDFLNSMVLPNDRTAVVANVEEGTLECFDLPTFQRTVRKIDYYVQDTCDVFLEFFPETQLMCVREEHYHAPSERSTLQLSYYAWPWKEEDDMEEEVMAPFEQWTSQGNQFSIYDKIEKVNDHSRYVWFRARQRGVIEIKILHITEKVMFEEKRISTDALSSPYFDRELEVAVNYVWEWRPDQLLLGCNTNKNNLLEEKGMQEINNNFVWDMKKDTIEELGFTMGKYQDLQVDMIGNGKISLFPTFFFSPGEVQLSPIYAIDNASGHQLWVTDHYISHKEKYNLLNYRNDTIVQYEYENESIDHVVVRKLEYANLTELSTFLLEGIASNNGATEGIDQALISDVIGQLPYEHLYQ